MAARVARNASVRGAAELVGKLASLALMAVLAREEGAAGLGVFAFALAWSELASTPIDMGFDRHLQRLVAQDRGALDRAVFNVLALKARRAVPIVAASWLLVGLLGFGAQTRTVVYLLTITYLLESLRWTLTAVFTAVERADLIGVVLLTQRLLAGALGAAALVLGHGVVGVAVAYVVAAAAAVAVGLRLVARHVGMPRFAFPAGPRAELRRESLAFAGQEFLSAGMARLDAILLSLLATASVVGLYSAAYRLLEATLFISIALLGAFSAMFTYLHERSEPTVGTVFGRALKLTVVLLLPCAIPLALLPGPILELLFGEGFGDAAGALAVLAPTVLALGVVMLCTGLIAARLDTRILVRAFAIAFAVNVVANLALIPALGAVGAALAMLLTELVLAAITLRVCFRAVGAPSWRTTLGGPLLAGSAMAVATALLAPLGVLVALAVGGAVYGSALVLVERRISPDDLDGAIRILRRRVGRSGEPVAEAG